MEPIEFIPHPGGLGLGATPKPPEPKKNKIKKPGEIERKVCTCTCIYIIICDNNYMKIHVPSMLAIGVETINKQMQQTNKQPQWL